MKHGTLLALLEKILEGGGGYGLKEKGTLD
jgi:hypothetical protein